MKQVIINPVETNTILSKNLQQFEIVGFKDNVGYQKGWLQPLKYSPQSTSTGYYPNYKAFCVDGGVHHGNGYMEYVSVDEFMTKNAVKINTGKLSVFVFDNEKDLFKWLSE